jgi:hypothetical protein
VQQWRTGKGRKIQHEKPCNQPWQKYVVKDQGRESPKPIDLNMMLNTASLTPRMAKMMTPVGVEKHSKNNARISAF